MNMSLRIDPAAWQAWALLLLFVCLVAAGVGDFRRRRIPNAVVVLALIGGVLLHTFGPQPFKFNDGLFTASPGALGFTASLLGALTGLAVFLPFYVLRLLGAGDVKLLSAVGAFAGTQAFLNIALWVLLAGGLLALVKMVVSAQSRAVVRNLVSLASGHFAPEQTVWRMPYAVAIGMGVAVHAGWTLSGRSPLLFG